MTAYRSRIALGRANHTAAQAYIFPPPHAQKTGDLHLFQLCKQQADCLGFGFAGQTGDFFLRFDMSHTERGLGVECGHRRTFAGCRLARHMQTYGAVHAADIFEAKRAA
jgi:hypothetical protein